MGIDLKRFLTMIKSALSEERMAGGDAWDGFYVIGGHTLPQLAAVLRAGGLDVAYVPIEGRPSLGQQYYGEGGSTGSSWYTVPLEAQTESLRGAISGRHARAFLPRCIGGKSGYPWPEGLSARRPHEWVAYFRWDDLPTFGGNPPEETTGVWSWDPDSLMVGDYAENLEIVPRRALEYVIEETTGVMVNVGPGVSLLGGDDDDE